MKVFLIAYAQNTIDALMNTLHKAGIKPHLLELAPLAIARCVNSPTSIVFDVRPGELDIVVTIDNIPELIRSVPLPPYNLIDENLPMILPIVLDELQRTITFCRSAKSIESLPIFGFGDLSGEIFDSLSTALNHPITLSYPPFHYPPEFPPDTCSVNLGLTLRKVKLSGYDYSRGVNVNLLPDIYKGRIVTQKALVAAGTTFGLGILVAILVLYLLASSETDRVRKDLETAQLLHDQVQLQQTKQQNDVNDLKTGKDQSAAELSKFKSSRSKLNSDRESINSDLEDLIEEPYPVLMELPSSASVSLTSSIGNTHLKLEGEEPRENLVLKYVRYLEDSDLFSEIILKWTSEEHVAYTLELQKGD